MREPLKTVSISQKIFLPEVEDILERAGKREFKYEFLPVVAYSDKEAGNPEIHNAQPIYMPHLFSLYESETPIESLLKYIGNMNIKKEELSVARKAFQKLQSFAVQCAERVTADLCCQIILEKSQEPGASPLLYLIEKPASDKMLGRLGYLYLDLSKITICFISYDPDDMVTTVMSAKTGKLLFDIHRLMSSNEDEIFTAPYPGSSEDSLVQTYFFRPKAPSPDNKFLPIRIDIFCQGLLESDIENKSKLVRDLLTDDSETQAYPIRNTDRSPFVKLPLGLQSVLKSWKEDNRGKRFLYDEILRIGEST